MAYTKVIIIGGGFGGLNAAKAFKNANVDVLLIDKTNHHLFQPLLYQVASAALSPGDIAVPIRQVLKNQENTTVIMGNVVSVDKVKRTVTLSNGDSFPYDYLIIATGAHHSYFGNDQWEEYAPGLKTLNDALTIREKVLLAYECAERCDSRVEAKAYLRFIIVGGGPTGVELAGSISDIAHKAMFKNFRKIKPEHTEIYLVEHAGQILPHFPPHLAEIAKHDLKKLGVKVMLNTKVTEINQEGAYVGETFIEARNIIWAAGNQAPAFLESLNVPLDRGKRVIVGPDLSIPDHPEVFVVGDSAHAVDSHGSQLPGIAPVAMQGGKYVANIIKKSIHKEDRKPFVYRDKGVMATIGRGKAVAMIWKLKFSGFLAWLTWCLIHVMYLVSFRNRLLVMTQWFFWYLTGSRSVRLITRFKYDKEFITPTPVIRDSHLETPKEQLLAEKQKT